MRLQRLSYICINKNIYIYMHTYTCMYIYIYIYISLSLSVCVHIYIYISVCVRVPVTVCVSVCIVHTRVGLLTCRACRFYDYRKGYVARHLALLGPVQCVARAKLQPDVLGSFRIPCSFMSTLIIPHQYSPPCTRALGKGLVHFRTHLFGKLDSAT